KRHARTPKLPHCDWTGTLWNHSLHCNVGWLLKIFTCYFVSYSPSLAHVCVAVFM
ncbi:hypothetical protein Csa_014755, partial [Cucumis sativus]